MKQLFVNKGTVLLKEVPEKKIEKGFVKVKTTYSCVSMGTELSGISTSGKTLFERIKENPSNIKKGINMVKEKGITSVKNTVDEKINDWQSIGYSSAGIIVEIGDGVQGFAVGDRVACAGTDYATHSQVITVPKNLVVKIPDEVSEQEASSVAIGSIAMQGIRQADVRLGEFVCVIGLGLIGQLTVQLLKASGANVIAVDLFDDKLELAKKSGADWMINSSTNNIVNQVSHITGAMGVDKVIITASTNSNKPLEQAFNICRKKGRVVLVGVVNLEINRSDMYKKELEFLISTSYGPGRYDSEYEEGGVDYPIQWCRFTENRNMQEYLRLLSSKKVKLDFLLEGDYSIDDAENAYTELLNRKEKPLMVTFSYKNENIVSTKIINKKASKKQGKINVAIVGPGGYAKSFHIPNLLKLENLYNIRAIVSRTGGNALKVSEGCESAYATTEYNDVLNDENIDVVFICTRHNTHAQLIIEALEKNKSVFVEKPLCVNREELINIEDALQKTNGALMVGYNRRFSPHALYIKNQLKDNINPIIINYTMNAGYIPKDSWIQTEEGAGRIIGEACHIFDLFNYFIEDEIEHLFVNSINPKTEKLLSSDNLVISVKYKNGSVCTLTYCANGSKDYQKERCEIFCDDKTFVLNDYKETLAYGIRNKGIKESKVNKGQLEELKFYANEYLNGNRFPISWEELKQTAELTFTVMENL